MTSLLKVNQIKARLRTLFEEHLDLTDISEKDQERETKVLSRCLAALAIYLQTACTTKEAGAAVWDGSDDNGIDAAYYDASDSRIIFVQSKWISKGAGEPEAKDIGVFVKGVRDVIENENDNFNPKLQNRLNDITLQLETPGTFVHLVVISTGASTLAKHGQTTLDQFLKELNGEDPEKIASSEVVGLNDVYSGLANDPVDGALEIDATLYDWSYVATPIPAYFGTVDGLQLKNWWKKNGKALVAKNIRHSLGATDVNKEIINTATNGPSNFWYFNNGITLVADDALKAPAGASAKTAGNFSFKGISLVNGAQTVSSLSRVEDDASLGHVRVPARVILLKTAPEGFGGEVARTNNFQNRIEPRDFVAQDPEQRRLRQEMAFEGVDYQFVRSEEPNVTSNTTCELLEVTTALACAAGDSSLAVQLKTGIGRFFLDLTKAPYKALFNKSVRGAYAFNATLTNRRIEAWIEFKKKTIGKKSGPKWGVLVHGNRILAAAVFKQLEVSNLSIPIAEFPKWLDKSSLGTLCESSYTKMVAGVEKQYPGKFLAVLFKNPRMSKHLYELALAGKSG